MDTATKVKHLEKLVLYDGVCQFCNSSINFILAKEKNDVLKFSPLQSDLSKDLSRIYNFDTTQLNTIIFIDNNKAYSKSKAVFLICSYLKFPWKLLQVFEIFPLSLSDFFYDLISKNRYSFFGKSDTCIAPNSTLQSRFLDSKI